MAKLDILRIFLCLFAGVCGYFQDYHYEYMSYDQIISKITEFGKNYPQYIQIHNITNTDLDLPRVLPCGSKDCQFVYYIMTDFSQSSQRIKQLPQVFLIGGLHGNEIVGSNAIIYLTKYFLENINTNDTLNYYMKNRMMIFYPMSNPYGYYNNAREEYQYGNYIYDPNRDFPYNLGSDLCYYSATARVLNYLFSNYLVRVAISFHGGTNSISYPWGSYNHLVSLNPIVSQQPPDDSALQEIAEVLSNAADENPELDIVYPVNGGSEDWAYAAGWENQISTSEPITQCYNEVKNSSSYNTSNIRAMLFLIECDYFKQPPSDTLGWASGLFMKNSTNWGHITRNIAASLALIDIVQPYIRDVEIKSNQLQINFTWKGGACVKVDSTKLFWRKSPTTALLNNITQYNSTMLEQDPTIIPTEVKSGDGYWSDLSNQFYQPITFSKETEIDAVIVMSCDKQWADLVIQTPLVAPQTHQTKARTDSSYSYKHKDFIINSEKNVFYYISNVKVVNQSNASSTVKINFYSTTLQSKLMACNPRSFTADFGTNNYFTFKYSDLLAFNSYQQITIKGALAVKTQIEEVKSSNLTAFIFENGDISECSEGLLGNNLNILKQNYVYFNDSFQFPFYFFENSLLDSKEIITSFDRTITNVSDFENLIGRTVVLRSFSVDDYFTLSYSPFYLGYITFERNYQCRTEAEQCLGISLMQLGVCFLLNYDEYFSSYTNFILKIFVSQSNSTTVNVELIVNLHYFIEKYTVFDTIVVKNELNEVNFSVNYESEVSFFHTDQKGFPLLSEKALGNAFSLKLISQNQRISLGVCDIVLVNSSFSVSQYVEDLNSQYPFSRTNSSEKQEKIIVLSLGIGVPTIFILLLVVCIVRKRKLRHNLMVVPTSGLLDTPKLRDLEKNEAGKREEETGQNPKETPPEDPESAAKIIKNSTVENATKSEANQEKMPESEKSKEIAKSFGSLPKSPTSKKTPNEPSPERAVNNNPVVQSGENEGFLRIETDIEEKRKHKKNSMSFSGSYKFIKEKQEAFRGEMAKGTVEDQPLFNRGMVYVPDYRTKTPEVMKKSQLLRKNSRQQLSNEPLKGLISNELLKETAND